MLELSTDEIWLSVVYKCLHYMFSWEENKN